MSAYVFHFGGGASSSDARAKDKTIVGGKGANLAEMAGIGLPVPPGFTISTEVCTAYNASGKTFDEALRAGVANGVSHIEKATGRVFGDATNPLLVSVRSGARVSMPGMMDTVLNLGLNDQTVEGLAAGSGDPRFAWDSYRRFIQMYSDVVLGLDHHRFEDALEIVKEDNGFFNDVELGAEHWQALVGEYKAIVADQLGRPFPQDVHEQLWGAIGAVFDSWESDRAKVYRKLNDIPHDWGTAVNVQAMVFGNMGDTSATGVAFTRDPATGEKAYYGEWLVNAQGEDVVAGIRNTLSLDDLGELDPKSHDQLMKVMRRLETHYRDLCDIEFTIERGKLWMLQTRVGKRTAAAAFRIAAQLVDEGMITMDEALARVSGSQLALLMFPQFDRSAPREILTKGMAASPGAAVGRAVFDSATAKAWADRGEQVGIGRGHDRRQGTAGGHPGDVDAGRVDPVLRQSPHFSVTDGGGVCMVYDPTWKPRQ